MAVEPLVTTQWLHQQMTKVSKDLRIVDRTWYVPAERERCFLTSMIDIFDINDGEVETGVLLLKCL